MSDCCTPGVPTTSDGGIARRRFRPALAELTGDEFNDLNTALEPASERARHFAALWSEFSGRGDFVAALAAGLAAAACRSAVDGLHASWFMARKMYLAIGDFDEPPIVGFPFGQNDANETTAQVLDKLVADIAESDKETLKELVQALPRFGQRSIGERLRQLRECYEWSNPNGILHDHPASACEALFRALLVSPVVHAEVQDDLMEVRTLRREARRFRDKIRAFDEHMQSSAGGSDTGQFLPKFSPDECERFRDSLDSLCAGDVRTRHKHEHSDRVAIVRVIADHFRRFLNLTREKAAAAFRVEPWSTGIAALAHAALNRRVSTEDVRGALKDWSSD